MEHNIHVLPRSEKYIAEALRPITEFRKYKVSSSMAIRDFLCC
jgi:hypothetical protein